MSPTIFKKYRRYHIVPFLICFILFSSVAFATAPAPSQPSIKIGVNLELTGDWGTFGQSELAGIRLAVKETNLAGGLLGRPIELIVEDNMTRLDETSKAMTKLIEVNEVVGVIGAVGSARSLVIAPIAQSARVPFISPTATSPRVTLDASKATNPFAFRACFEDPWQGVLLSQFALNTFKAKNAAILYEMSSQYSIEVARLFEESFKKSTGTSVSKQIYFQRANDFSVQLKKLFATSPDVLVLTGYYDEAALITKQAREIGYKGPILGSDGIDSPKFIEIGGVAATQNTYYITHFDAADPDSAAKKFVIAYQREYNKLPDSLAALGYDSAKMLFMAIASSGSTNSAQMIATLENLKNFEGASGKILRLSETHNPIKSGAMIEIRDGKPIFHSRVTPVN
jgi:branched-chain amino acid transport system substrate-binding protein